MFSPIKLVKLAIVLAIGFGAGMWYERFLMRSECTAGEGDWSGTICLNSDLAQ